MKSDFCSNKPLLLFDFGRIIVSLDKQRSVNALRQIGCGNIAGYVDEVRQEDLFHNLEIGGSKEEFYDDARRLSATTAADGTVTPCTATDADITWAWNQLLTGIPVEKLRLIHHLRHDLGYRTALLSNTNRIHWDMSVEQLFTADGLTVSDYFERTFLSCDMHMLKPEAPIYNKVAEELHVSPSDILFIDDSKANCLGAERCGYHTFYDPHGSRWTTQLLPLLRGEARAAVIGNYDGVHRGHAYVLSQLKTIASERGLKPLAITFDRHPRSLFKANFVPEFLNTTAERIERIDGMLSDSSAEMQQGDTQSYVHLLHFTQEMAQTPAREFMEHTLRDELGVQLLLLGYDNHFGRRTDGEGFEDYKRYGEELGIEVVRCEPYDFAGDRVSSSFVRHLIKDGRMEEANAALGYDFTLEGPVVHGFAEGRKIGFPTANILPPEGKILPPNGVYVTEATIEGDAHKYLAITNIGNRPTFKGTATTIETHIPGFSQDIYGRRLSLAIKRMLRSEMRFDSIEELRAQIAKDIQGCGL